MVYWHLIYISCNKSGHLINGGDPQRVNVWHSEPSHQLHRRDKETDSHVSPHQIHVTSTGAVVSERNPVTANVRGGPLAPCPTMTVCLPAQPPPSFPLLHWAPMGRVPYRAAGTPLRRSSSLRHRHHPSPTAELPFKLQSAAASRRAVPEGRRLRQVFGGAASATFRSRRRQEDAITVGEDKPSPRFRRCDGHQPLPPPSRYSPRRHLLARCGGRAVDLRRSAMEPRTWSRYAPSASHRHRGRRRSQWKNAMSIRNPGLSLSSIRCLSLGFLGYPLI